MSGKNGNGRIGKHQKRVAELAGLAKGEQLPYAPDYFDSLIRRMATPGGDWAERTFAWLLYRASGNQSTLGQSGIAAIHLYSRGGEKPEETELRQRDCCLDLAWLEAGHRPEWLDAPLDLFREEAARRGVEPIDKARVSDGFTENRERGTVATGTGHRLELDPSPKVADSREILAEEKAKGTFHERFDAWAKVAHSSKYQEREVARSVNKEITKFLLSEYKVWLKSETPPPNAGTSLEALETIETLEAGAVAVVVNLTHKSTEEKTPGDFQKPTTIKPPEPQLPQKYATDRDELIAVIESHTGRRPDVKLMRDITETLELRQWTLRQYLDDIIPRIGRLKRPPGEGFFLSHAQKVGGVATEPAPEPKPLEEKTENGRCKKCNGVGQVNGGYCTCKLGLELERYAVKDDPQKAAIPNGKAQNGNPPKIDQEHHGIHNGVTAKGPG